MKSSGENKLTRRKTAGGGLCAFAGFAQGLVDHALLGHFDAQVASGRFQPFLNIFADLTKDQKEPKNQCKPNWPDFIQYLREHLTPPKVLQVLLAKALRRLLVQLRKEGPGVTEGELEALQVALRAYIAKNAGIRSEETGYRGDDIFSRHKFILAKFEALRLKHFGQAAVGTLKKSLATLSTKEEQNRLLLKTFDDVASAAHPELVQWYSKEGYALFTSAMANDHEYAGDLELKYLARFWDVTFKVERTTQGIKFVHSIHYDFGRLRVDQLTAAEAALLKDLSILNRTSDHPNFHPFLEMTEECVLARTATFEYADQIMTLWDAWQKENSHLKPNERKPVVIPVHWSDASLIELFTRNLLVRKDNSCYFPPQQEMNRSRFLEVLRPFVLEVDRQKIIGLWKTHYKARPEIRCANDNAEHWEYCQPEGYPWNTLKSAASFFSSAYKFTQNTFSAAISTVVSMPFKTEAAEAIKAIEEDLCRHDVNEKSFYVQMVIPKLQEIVKTGKVTTENAMRLFDPELVFSIINKESALTPSYSLDIVKSFCTLFYFRILTAAYGQVIGHVPSILEFFYALINRIELGYDFCLITDLRDSNSRNAEERSIYLSPEGQYSVLDLNGQWQQAYLPQELRVKCKQFVKDMTITKNRTAADIKRRNLTINDIEFKQRILEVTSDRKHTLTHTPTVNEVKLVKALRDYIDLAEKLYNAGPKLPKLEHLQMYNKVNACALQAIERVDLSKLMNQYYFSRVNSFTEYMDCVITGMSLSKLAEVILEEWCHEGLSEDNLLYQIMQCVIADPSSAAEQDSDTLCEIKKSIPVELKDFPELQVLLTVFFDQVIESIPAKKPSLY